MGVLLPMEMRDRVVGVTFCIIIARGRQASFAARFLFFVAFRWRESGALRYLGTAPPPCSLRCSRNSAISLRAAC